MKNFTHRIALGALAAACLLVTAQSSEALSFHVDINTTPLVGDAGAPFSLDIQFNNGSISNNSVTLTNFVFTGGSLQGGANLSGGASGDMGSTVQIADTNQINEIFQGFSGSVTGIHFDVSTTANTDGITPDQFAVAILDSNLFNIPTTAPGTDLLLSVPVTATSSNSDIATYTSTSPAGVSVSVQAVPEPSTIATVVGGFGALLALRRRRRS